MSCGCTLALYLKYLAFLACEKDTRKHSYCHFNAFFFFHVSCGCGCGHKS